MADCFSLPNVAELVEMLRVEAEAVQAIEWEIPICTSKHLAQAADAIEQFAKENAKLKAEAVHWHKITTRPLTDEEKEWYAEQGYEPNEMPEFMYDCEMPEDGQEILIATPWGTDKDICSNEAEYGIGMEGHDDFDNVYAWAEMPEWRGVQKRKDD